MAGAVIVETKLQPPSVRANSAARSDLVARLQQVSVSLTVIIAPTGWGKSQLLALWLDTRSERAAFVRLDGLDNDPARCWTHILTAVERAAKIDFGALIGSLRAPGLPLATEIVAPMIQALDSQDLTLVLDDFHLVTDVSIHESIEALIDYAPPELHLVIASRTEPPLHLPRRRVRGEVLEIRLADLRLTAEEAAPVLAAAAQVELEPGQVHELVARTEGWPAGLYLAGLSMRASRDIDGFVAAFAGDDRNISEFLASELLASFDVAERDFLLDTAVLEELDAETCEAMTGREDSGGFLEELARSNLFLIPLDSNAGKHRYHHLFKQWLELELSRRDGSAVAEAHRKAAQFYMLRGEAHQAMAHAVSGKDWAGAYQLVFIHGGRIMDDGNHATLSNWIHQFPKQQGAVAVNLAVIEAWLAVIDGDPDTAMRCCRIAEEEFTAGDPFSDPVYGASEIALLRAYALFLRGDLVATADHMDEAKRNGVSDRTAVTLRWLEAATNYWLGQGERQELAALSALAEADGGPYVTVLGEAYLAHFHLDHMEPRDALVCLDKSFDALDGNNLTSFGYAALSHLARARLALGDGEAEAAKVDCERAVELSSRRNETLVWIASRLVAAEIHHALGSKADARQQLRLATDQIDLLSERGILAERAATVKRQLRLPASSRPKIRQDYVEPLSDREMTLLRMLPGDLSQRELGRAMHVSFNTVKTFNRQIYRKLGVTSRDDAVAEARLHGLL